MSAAFTPGPWKFVTDFICSNGELTTGVMSSKTGSAVAWLHGRDDAEEMANAKLVAACPEMADLLARVRGEYVRALADAMTATTPDRPFSEVMAEARGNPIAKEIDALLRRATGAQP